MKLSSGTSGPTYGMSCTRLIILSLVVALHASGVSASRSNRGYEICRSESCKDIANEYLSSMDFTIDPCTDFYQYTCGNWAKSHPPAVHADKWTHFGIVANKTNFRLKGILETEGTTNETASLRKAKQLYKACMDEETIELQGTSTIRKILRLSGGWPLITNSSVDPQPLRSWQTLDSYYNRLLGSSPIFNLGVIQDIKDSNKNVLTITPPSAGNPPPILLSQKKKFLDLLFAIPAIMKYKTYIKEVAKAMMNTSKITVSDAQLETDAENIVFFELALKRLTMIRVDPNAPTLTYSDLQKSMTIADLQVLYDAAKPRTPVAKIDWLHRIKDLFTGINSVSIDSSERIVVTYQRYFEGLVKLLDKTPERVIVNTIHWGFVKQTIGLTNRKMSEIADEYAEKALPVAVTTPQATPRWMKCIAGNELQHALAHAYVEKYFPANAKETAREMVHQIKVEMKKEITEARWLDEATKEAAREKITSMTKFIGYPDWYKDPSELEKRYTKLSIGSSYVDNALQVKRFALRLQLEALREPVDKYAWIASPVAVNAFYSPTGNSLTFPAGILQMPFFDAGSPDSVNYGGIGYVIAHEVSHGFDNVGSQFDKDGNAKEWWSNRTRQEFTERTQCFVEQFDRFKHRVTGGIASAFLKLGLRTLGENIADSTGMKAAFEAYKTHVRTSGRKEVRLPGLENFNGEQLFFLSFAGAFCEDMKEDKRLEWILKDPHSPAPLRVIGSLANTEAFAETFQCARGTAMNPIDKCTIW